MYQDKASLILNKIECFFDIDDNHLEYVLEDIIYFRYLKNDNLY